MTLSSISWLARGLFGWTLRSVCSRYLVALSSVAVIIPLRFSLAVSTSKISSTGRAERWRMQSSVYSISYRTIDSLSKRDMGSFSVSAQMILKGSVIRMQTVLIGAL